MTKRFTDTEKWRKGFIRSLQAPYKLLWFYICDECDHAGIWHVELDVAGLRIGKGINIDNPLEAFGDHIVPFDNGEKWFIPDFIDFQYGELNPANRVHQSVIARLNKYGLNKAHISPLQRAKDKDKDKDKEKAKDKDKDSDPPKGFDEFWQAYPKKTGKQAALRAWKKAIKVTSASNILEAVKCQLAWPQWTKDNGQYIPNPATWLNQGRWEDEIGTQSVIPMEKLTTAEQLQRRNDEALRRAMEE